MQVLFFSVLLAHLLPHSVFLTSLRAHSVKAADARRGRTSSCSFILRLKIIQVSFAYAYGYFKGILSANAYYHTLYHQEGQRRAFFGHTSPSRRFQIRDPVCSLGTPIEII